MSGQSAGRSPGPVRRRIRLAMIAVIAGATLLVTAGIARADTWEPSLSSAGFFNHTEFGDCTVKAGPVRDPDPNATSSWYRIIGGVTVHCTTRHNLAACVAEYIYNNGAPYAIDGQRCNPPSTNNFVANTHGWEEPNILETAKICHNGGPLSGSWYTRAWVADYDASGRLLSSLYVVSPLEPGAARAC